MYSFQGEHWYILYFFFLTFSPSFFVKFEQIVCWVWAWFIRSARGCSQAQWHMQIYVNCAQPCDTCCRPRCVITSGGAVCYWEIPVGADLGSRTSIPANGHIQETNACTYSNIHSSSVAPISCCYSCSSLHRYFCTFPHAGSQFFCLSFWFVCPLFTPPLLLLSLCWSLLKWKIDACENGNV